MQFSTNCSKLYMTELLVFLHSDLGVVLLGVPVQPRPDKLLLLIAALLHQEVCDVLQHWILGHKPKLWLAAAEGTHTDTYR